MLLDPEIVIFPSGPTAVPSSMESNWPVLLTLIMVPVVFALVTLVPDRVADLTVVLVPLVVDRVGDLTLVLVVLLVVVRVAGGGGSSNAGGATPR